VIPLSAKARANHAFPSFVDFICASNFCIVDKLDAMCAAARSLPAARPCRIVIEGTSAGWAPGGRVNVCQHPTNPTGTRSLARREPM